MNIILDFIFNFFIISFFIYSTTSLSGSSPLGLILKFSLIFNSEVSSGKNSISFFILVIILLFIFFIFSSASLLRTSKILSLRKIFFPKLSIKFNFIEKLFSSFNFVNNIPKFSSLFFLFSIVLFVI